MGVTGLGASIKECNEHKFTGKKHYQRSLWLACEHGIYYTVEVAGSVVFWGQTGKPENISLDDSSNPDPTPEQVHAREIALAALTEKARMPLRVPRLPQDSIVKVWYTIFTDDPAGNLGAPAFAFSVQGSGQSSEKSALR